MEIKRDVYLDKLIRKKKNGLIKVVTGVRRCGKSYLLFRLFHDHLLENGVPEDHMIEVALTMDKAYRAQKAIQDYVFTDGLAEKSVERKFAESLDGAEEVLIYAKLPRDFYIPTPVGHYSPDWAIVFREGKVKHIYFVAETKGTMESLNLRPIEKSKIDCAKKLFERLSNGLVTYDHVDSYQELLNKVLR